MAMVAMGAAALLGTGMSVYGQIKRGEAEQAAAEANARAAERAAGWAERNAGLAYTQSLEEARREEVSNRKALGGIRAAYGASGIRMDGSAKDYLEDNAAIAAANVTAIKYKGQLAAEAYKQQAQQYRAQGESYQGQADYASSAGIVGGFAEGLRGLGTFGKDIVSGASYGQGNGQSMRRTS
jgi:hypothetical protein